MAAMAGDRGAAGGAETAADAGEAAPLVLLLKATTSPSGFLITTALLTFLGRSKVEAGTGLAAVTLGVCVCEMWLTFVMAGVVGCGTTDCGRSDMLEGVRDMTGAWGGWP